MIAACARQVDGVEAHYLESLSYSYGATIFGLELYGTRERSQPPGRLRRFSNLASGQKASGQKRNGQDS